MDIIVLTYPEPIEKEHLFVKKLFEAGLETLHVRKPYFSKGEMFEYLGEIPMEYLDRVVLHSHWDLNQSFPIKGLHGFSDPGQKLREGEERWEIKTEERKNVSDTFDLDAAISDMVDTSELRGTRSCSLHSLEEAESISSLYQYAFLSPVYDSLSKEGYTSGFGMGDLQDFLYKNPRESRNTKWIALGGVDEDNVLELQTMSFDGVALLGAIWQESNYNRIKKLERIQEELC